MDKEDRLTINKGLSRKTRKVLGQLRIVLVEEGVQVAPSKLEGPNCSTVKPMNHPIDCRLIVVYDKQRNMGVKTPDLGHRREPHEESTCAPNSF